MTAATSLAFEYIAPHDEVTRHMWTVKGKNGAVHIWAEPTPAGFQWPEKFYGGVEVHSPKRLYESSWASQPSSTDCWLLNGLCWHDGSSSYFSERIEPMIRNEDLPFRDHVNSFIYSILADWYYSKFEKSEDAA